MSEMVELVARIIDPELWLSYDRARREGWDAETRAMTERNVQPSLAKARAFFEAIREPTEAMIDAADADDWPLANWRVMIDAALGKEG